MRTLLIASQKGGVGKTTTSVNLATLSAESGNRVLLLDADPLGSVATSFQLSRTPTESAPPRPDTVTGVGVVWNNVLPQLDVICPYPANDTAERHLEAFLAALPTSPLARVYDTVIVDAPPMPGPRTKALLKAAGEAILVQRAEPLSFRTLPSYLEMVREVKNEGSNVRLRGILLTLSSGTAPGGKAEKKLREQFKCLLSQTIPFDPEISRALLLGKPVVVTSPNCAASKQYRSLAQSMGLVPTAVMPVSANSAIASKPQRELVAAKPAAASSVPKSMVETPAPIGEASVETLPPPRPRLTPKPRQATAEVEQKRGINDFPLPLPQRNYATGDGVPGWMVGLSAAFVGALGAFLAWWFTS